MKLKNIFNKMGKKEETNQTVNDETVVKDQEGKASNETTQDTDIQNEKSDNPKGDTEEISQLKTELAEAKDKYLRLFAEFDNYRKRTNKEKLEMRKTAAADTLSALLPILDDFDRAKKNHDDENSTEEFSEGIMFVYDKILTFMKQQGLEATNPTGEVFNADFHEAITEIPAPTEEMKGKIIDTIEKGYQLNEKIIRYAKVVVGK